MEKGFLNVALAQISPVWLDREKTIDKVIQYVNDASEKGSQLVTFGEALIPGYPFWVERTEGARFNSQQQKEIFAIYSSQAVNIEEGHLDKLCKTAKDKSIAIIVGIIERASDRGGHSLYCSLVYINQLGEIKSVHRKLMPTYEERLVWSLGDGNGLQVHKLGDFTVGGLNCWENWMPLPRTALYAQGEDLHVAIWPGGIQNTIDLTRHIAREARSYVISVSGLFRKEDIPDDFPLAELMRNNSTDVLANGGSCISAPDGSWIVEPVVDEERLIVATLDHKQVRMERHNFDPSGHYSRPDVTQLIVNRERQGVVKFKD
ncbi:MAG: carbon-nitrogen hydrolase family protein [Mariniphaga sp.]|nr:carbon-nitrogen hydrolase family protein [Mariniphaga sp.]